MLQQSKLHSKHIQGSSFSFFAAAQGFGDGLDGYLYGGMS